MRFSFKEKIAEQNQAVELEQQNYQKSKSQNDEEVPRKTNTKNQEKLGENSTFKVWKPYGWYVTDDTLTIAEQFFSPTLFPVPYLFGFGDELKWIWYGLTAYHWFSVTFIDLPESRFEIFPVVPYWVTHFI